MACRSSSASISAIPAPCVPARPATTTWPGSMSPGLTLPSCTCNRATAQAITTGPSRPSATLRALQAPPVLDALQHWPASDIYLFLEPIHPFEAEEDSVLQDLHESVRYWRDAMREKFWLPS